MKLCQPWRIDDSDSSTDEIDTLKLDTKEAKDLHVICDFQTSFEPKLKKKIELDMDFLNFPLPCRRLFLHKGLFVYLTSLLTPSIGLPDLLQQCKPPPAGIPPCIPPCIPPRSLAKPCQARKAMNRSDIFADRRIVCTAL
jgi:hypothetical protein